MSFNILTTKRFERAAKILAKRHRSFVDDLKEFINSLEENPLQGDEIAPGIRKIRLTITSKGRGKSGGARVITFYILTTENDGDVYLIDLYDKADFSTVNVSVIKNVIAELGLMQ